MSAILAGYSIGFVNSHVQYGYRGLLVWRQHWEAKPAKLLYRRYEPRFVESEERQFGGGFEVERPDFVVFEVVGPYVTNFEARWATDVASRVSLRWYPHEIAREKSGIKHTIGE